VGDFFLAVVNFKTTGLVTEKAPKNLSLISRGFFFRRIKTKWNSLTLLPLENGTMSRREKQWDIFTIYSPSGKFAERAK